MDQANRGLLADLAKERMEREAKRRKVQAEGQGAHNPGDTISKSQRESSAGTLSDDAFVKPDDKEKTAAVLTPSSNNEEVVVLSDDDECVERQAKQTDSTQQSTVREQKSKGTGGEGGHKPPWELKVLTYNLWFEVSVSLSERMSAIGNIILAEQPDMILMQEVVPEMELLFKTATWFKNYHPSRRPQNMAYYTLLFVHKSVEILSPSDRHEFSNSQMGRDVLSVCVNVRGKNLVVATSHLESLTEFKAGPAKSAQLEVRKQQLAEAQKRLEVFAKRLEGATGAAPTIVYAGDMNWNDQETGKPQLKEGWADPWSVLYPRDPGYTYDGPRNCMLVNKFRNRLDRFFCRLRGVQVVSMRMVGLDPIPGVQYRRSVYGNLKTLPVSPSDHFGLLAVFREEGSFADQGSAGSGASASGGGIRSFFKRTCT